MVCLLQQSLAQTVVANRNVALYNNKKELTDLFTLRNHQCVALRCVALASSATVGSIVSLLCMRARPTSSRSLTRPLCLCIRESEFQQLLDSVCPTPPDVSPEMDAHLDRIRGGCLGDLYGGMSNHDVLFSRDQDCTDVAMQVGCAEVGTAVLDISRMWLLLSFFSRTILCVPSHRWQMRGSSKRRSGASRNDSSSAA